MSQRLFTSAKLTADSFCKRITLLGTVHKTSQRFCLCFVPVRGDLWDQACFFPPKSKLGCPMCRKRTRQLYFYAACLTKNWSMRCLGRLMILNYNKGSVDRVDQLWFCETESPWRRRINKCQKVQKVPHLPIIVWSQNSGLLHFQAVALHC